MLLKQSALSAYTVALLFIVTVTIYSKNFDFDMDSILIIFGCVWLCTSCIIYSKDYNLDYIVILIDKVLNYD